jgi:hypothetical protein
MPQVTSIEVFIKPVQCVWRFDGVDADYHEEGSNSGSKCGVQMVKGRNPVNVH